jgi:hypothetical protein
VVKSGVIADEDFKKACQAILRKLARERDWVVGKVARQAIATPLRHYFDDAVDHLRQSGHIEIESVTGTGQGLRLRLSGTA